MAAAVAVAVIATAATVYSVENSKQQAREAADQNRMARERNDKLISQAKDKKKTEEARAAATKLRDDKRAIQMSAGANGREDTILTGNLLGGAGAPGTSPSAPGAAGSGKTLLGQ